jgi:hypothetical protein
MARRRKLATTVKTVCSYGGGLLLAIQEASHGLAAEFAIPE